MLVGNSVPNFAAKAAAGALLWDSGHFEECLDNLREQWESSEVLYASPSARSRYQG